MPLGDTIAAIASTPGRTVRAIVRVSGPATASLLGTIIRTEPDDSPSGDRPPAALRARLWLTDSLSFPVLIIRSFAPRSYTGEDTCEILIPGNPHLAERVLARLLGVPGVRLASPGEFTARAYLNGKLTLQQAEGVAATIAAEDREQLAAARELLSGATGSTYRAWADELTTMLALVEAGIDFTDQEDVVPIAPRELHARLSRLRDGITSHLGAAAATEATTALPRVVLVGRPNAGKSTLFNALLGRRRAVVSDVAGTTRDVLEETLDLTRDLPGGCPVMLVDLAGLDESLAAPGTLDAHAQRQARHAIESGDAIIYCDPAGRFDLRLPRKPTLRVQTKADLPTAPAVGGVTGAELPAAIAICALDGWNLPVLRRAIVDAVSGSRAAGIAGLLPRHRRQLSQARLALGTALGGVDPHSAHLPEPEVIADSLRAALDALGELIGRISPDDVIGRIFATFCVGK
jgi:tRNA modification GTPase